MNRPLNFPQEYLFDDIATEKVPQNKHCEVLHIGVVCSGYNSNVFFHTFLKSLFFYRANPIHFHIIANKISRNVLTVLFNTWRLPDVNATFYDSDDYIKYVRWVPNTHYSGNYGLLKLLFPNIIQQNVTKKLLVLDTDITVMSDIYELWELFYQFDKAQVIGLVENQSDYYLGKLTQTAPWPAISKGYNTGVILYDLYKLQNLNWDKLWSNITKRTATIHGPTGLGDQDVINALIKENPNIVFDIPCYWNTQMGDNSQSSSCYTIYKPKIVHWNSPRKYNVGHKDGRYFKSITLGFMEYNGNLARNLQIFCKEPVKSISVNHEGDVCAKFDTSAIYRTLLFFKEFKYEPSENEISLVSHLSIDRITSAENIGRSWKGPIAFSLYLSDAELLKVMEFISESDVLSERSNIAYHVIFKQGDLYPINYLRNVGLKHVRTPFVFLMDIDFSPMPNLYENLKSHLALGKDFDKKAFIVPAFEVTTPSILRTKVPKTKLEMLKALENGTVTSFMSKTWPAGHAPTDIDQWKSAVDPYKINWQPDFEPYIVVRSNVVQYDETFIGFGWNKVSHIMELEAQEYEFIVLPDVFVIHTMHALSNDNLRYKYKVKYRMCLQLLKKNFIEKLNKVYNKSFTTAQIERNRVKREINPDQPEMTTTLYDSTDFYLIWGGKEKYFGKKIRNQPIKEDKANIKQDPLEVKEHKEELLKEMRNMDDINVDLLRLEEYDENSNDTESFINIVFNNLSQINSSATSENLTVISFSTNEDILKNIADNINAGLNKDLNIPIVLPESLDEHTTNKPDSVLYDVDDYTDYDYEALEKHYREKFRQTQIKSTTVKTIDIAIEEYLDSDETGDYHYSDEDIEENKKLINKTSKAYNLDTDKKENIDSSVAVDELSKIKSNQQQEITPVTTVLSSRKPSTTMSYEFQDIYEEFRVKFKDFHKIPRQN